ncbi:MAG: hypothetical protein CM15mP77_0260 [Synechococcus sp.]|nr:MAG: hypothetical protein CM15mP77_0260 [Synechococcus sp.]
MHLCPSISNHKWRLSLRFDHFCQIDVDEALQPVHTEAMQSCPVRPLPLLALGLVSACSDGDRMVDASSQSGRAFMAAIDQQAGSPDRTAAAASSQGSADAISSGSDVDLLRSMAPRQHRLHQRCRRSPLDHGRVLRWLERELEANADEEALLFTSGPTLPEAAATVTWPCASW